MDKLLSKLSHGVKSNTRSALDNGMTCGSCGSLTKARINCSRSGCIVPHSHSNVCLTHGRRPVTEEDNSLPFGRPIRDKIMATLRRTFGGRRMHQEPFRSLQGILVDLKLLNGWLANRIKFNEVDYSYYKGMLELEERKLEKNCSALKESEQSLILLCKNASSEKQDNQESQHEIRQETVRLEADVRRHEPALYHKYQALQRIPGNRDVILNAIRTSITDKLAALEKMEVLLGLNQRNLAHSDEHGKENPVMMLLPTTNMPMLPSSDTDEQSESPMKRLHFIYPMGAAATQEDFRGSFA